MPGLLVVLPVLDPGLARPCTDSIFADNSACGIPPSEILIVDNTRGGLSGTDYGDQLDAQGFRRYRNDDGHNLGVARSWNVGARKMLVGNCDYLVIMSAVMLFGPELHTTWRKQMETFWGSPVIEADGHSWHLIALHRTIFEQVGLFDENFYPAYFEQIDFGRRMHVLGLEGGFERVWVNAISRGHGQHIPFVDCPAQPLLRYYAQKWGGAKGFEKFKQPWGLHPMGHWDDRPIPELAAAYELTNWW